MRVLVTGGCGFIGQNLVKRLLKDGHDVTVTATGAHPVPDGVNVTTCCLHGIDWDMVSEQDVIFHQAAITDTRYGNDQEIMRANYEASLQLFNTARMGGNCKKFICASSTAVYGNELPPYRENLTTESPLNVYAHSKLKVDNYLRTQMTKMDIVILRYCNVYGPGEEHKGPAMSMLGQMLRTVVLNYETPKVFYPGDQRRDWVYVDDVVDANIKAMESHEVSGIFNIGTGESHSFNEITELIKDTFYGVVEGEINTPQYIECPFPDQYQNNTCCCIERAKRVLGWTPQYTLEKGIQVYQKILLDHIKKAQ